MHVSVCLGIHCVYYHIYENTEAVQCFVLIKWYKNDTVLADEKQYNIFTMSCCHLSITICLYVCVILSFKPSSTWIHH